MARLFRRSKAPARAENIDELTRLNRGFGSFFAEDTGEQPGFILPFNKTMKGELAYRQGYQPRQVMAQEQPQEQVEEFVPPELEQMPNEQGNVLGANDNPYDLNSYEGFTQFLNDVLAQPEEPTSEQLQSIQQITGQPFAVASHESGGVIYSDGSVRSAAEAPTPIQSISGNRVLWSDGIVRNGGVVDYNATSAYATQGAEGLSNLLFGQQQAVTQPYGNINPIEPTPGNVNLGTDFRTRDLMNKTQRLPIPVEVVKVIQDDGIANPYQSQTQGYGNSVLVRMPNGMMLRLSHLANLEGIQEGRMYQPGEFTFTPGGTGNVTGEHLDVEVYDQNGQIINPNAADFADSILGSFTGINRPGAISDPYNPTNQELFSQQPNQQPASPQPQAPSRAEQPMERPVTPPASVINPKISPNINPASPRPKLGTAVNKAGDVLGLNTQGTLGLGELAAGDRPAAAREIEQTGQRLNIPKIGASEVVRGDVPQAGKELSGTITQANLTPRVDVGVSEMLRGDLGGAKTVFNDTKARLLARIGEGLDAVTPDAFAAETEQPSPQSEPQTKTIINQVADNVTGLAGKGLDRLKGAFSNLSNQQRPNMSDLGGNKAIGDSPSGEVLGITSAESQRPTQDTRDPFYKSGMNNKYASFMNPIGTDNRTLTTGTFNNDFFSDPNRVSEVFSGSVQAPKAQSMYIDNVKKQYASKYADPNVYDQADVQRVLASIGDTDLGYTPNLSAPKLVPPPEPERQPSIDEYLSKGKTVEQWYAETGRQSELDAIRRSGGDPVAQAKDITNRQAGGVSSGSNQNFTPAYANYTDAKTGNASYTPPPARSQAVQNYTPTNANYTSGSGRAVYKAPPVQTPKKDENLFSRAYNSITKLFRR